MALLEPGRDPGDQAASAERHDHGVQLGPGLLDQLHRHRALARDRPRIVERRHVDRTAALGIGVGGRTGHVVGAALHDQLDLALPQRQDRLALLPGGVGGHVDPTPHTEPGAAPGQPLPVVAGTRAHHAARPLGLAEAADEVVGAADLVGAGQLPVLALQQHLGVHQPAEPAAALQIGAPYDGAQHLGRSLDRRRINSRCTHDPTLVAGPPPRRLGADAGPSRRKCGRESA